MFEEVLSKNAKESLVLLGKSGILDDAYLAGGTALALRMGHRISVDFDFFTRKDFNESLFIKKLVSLPIHFQLERSGKGTILGYINKTRFY